MKTDEEVDELVERIESKDRSWMTRENLEVHYESAMINWDLTLDERDDLIKEVKQLKERIKELESKE